LTLKVQSLSQASPHHHHTDSFPQRKTYIYDCNERNTSYRKITQEKRLKNRKTKRKHTKGGKSEKSLPREIQSSFFGDSEAAMTATARQSATSRKQPAIAMLNGNAFTVKRLLAVSQLI